jgi:hypothetical protein
MAMAIGPDDFAAYQIASASKQLALAPPNEPIWAVIPAVALQGMSSLPAAAKAYVPALQSAEQIILSVGADPANQLLLGVQVTCKDAAAASALLTQFESTTNALRQMLSKVHQKPDQKPDPADLTAVLVAGTFHRSERQVYGAWPIPRAFVDAITGGSY